MICVIGDNLEGADILLEYGANPNYSSPEGKDLLFWAVSDEMKELLYRYGAVVDE